jgi:hypothetical protein
MLKDIKVPNNHDNDPFEDNNNEPFVEAMTS